MKKHTPGPWYLNMNSGPIVTGPNGEQVCDMRRGMGHRDEDVGNIRLIVAAPVLLAKLEEMTNLFEGLARVVLCDKYVQSPQEKDACDLIAALKGE